MKTYQQKYEDAWNAAQEGGMSSGDSHEFAVDQASRPVAETKFTPGPWSFSPTVGDYTAKDRLYIRSQAISHSNCSADVIVAELKNHRYGSADRRPTLPAEQIANARLIAAAPEMFEALREIMLIMDNQGMRQTPAKIKARAALAKAKGECPVDEIEAFFNGV